MQQFRCLQALSRGGPLELTTGLARHFRVAVPTITKMLDGLVERGLVERSPDPGSRRQILVRLTEEGRVLLRRYDGIVEKLLRQLLGRLDVAQKRRLMEALGDLSTVLDDGMSASSERELKS
jgi:DNA-binding MarR family transcriptional regulator